MQNAIQKLSVSDELQYLFKNAPSITFPTSREHLFALALGNQKDVFEIGYEVENKGYVREAVVTRASNGLVVNYDDIYLRRRDPDCMLIADSLDTDKERFEERYGHGFEDLRQRTFDWMAKQDLIVMPFLAGGLEVGYESLLVAPLNAGFFAGGLADLQYFIPEDEIRDGFTPKAVIYLAPPFRHTDFDGKQMVVHNRLEEMYELFSYNLYPGPSAKKGVYGILIHIGEKEGWATLHGSTVSVITPYDNTLNIMHEGASGGGKSEMAEKIHRDEEGQILVAKHKEPHKNVKLELRESCEIRPVTDDMALCHPKMQKGNLKLTVTDAENGWFLRTDGIKSYGTDPYLEKLTIHPKEPLIFLNYQTTPGATCLIWEHIEDEPGIACPNPRVIVPRHHIPNVIDEGIEIDIRSFGVRTPFCTRKEPSYGIIGMLHVLPPALAWLWRLVSPRGHANPSVTDSSGKMMSEGVGSYWPFSTGKKVIQANIILEQILNASETRYILLPNQHIGAYEVGFMPQWIAREFLARRGSASFKQEQLMPSRSTLLGYCVASMKMNGIYIPDGLLRVHKQKEVGKKAYDEGARMLTDFFKVEVKQFLTDDLHPLGRQIIECCLNDGKLNDYIELIPMRY
jgi:hypothetical protein